MVEKIKNWAFKDKRVFAEGLSKDKLFWVFMFGSVFGVYFEQIQYMIRVYLKRRELVWALRRGVIYAPLNPLYGVGAVLMTYLLLRKKRSKFQTFMLGAFIGGFFEYAISFLQETFTGQISWDYSNMFLNIGGRTTLPYMAVWGVFSLAMVYVVYPWLSKWIEKIPYNVGKLITRIVFILVVVDCLISWGAIIRWGLRVKGVKPYTFIGEFFDKFYPDSFLQGRFPNMRVRP